MSDNEKDQPMFRNEDTLHRRAWIDRALSGVRGRLPQDEEGELARNAAPTVSRPTPMPGQRPRFYVVRNRASR